MKRQEPPIKEEHFLEKEWLGSDTLKIRLQDGIDPNQVIPQLLVCFEKYFKEDIVRFLLDMENVSFPNGSFIAMLIGMTTEARRRGGDFKLFNVSETARNHFSTFTPLTYLSIGQEEDFLDNAAFDAYSQSFIDELGFETGKPVSIQVAARVDSLQTITDLVTRLAQKVKMDPTEVSKLKIAVYEACMNVIEHGYHFHPGEEMGIEILHETDIFKVTIIDHAEPFDFFGIKSYNVSESFENKQRGGYGTYIIRHSVDNVTYEPDPKTGNRLILVKKIIPVVSEDLRLGKRTTQSIKSGKVPGLKK
ncbi:MAG TPA: hypothetical protein ENN17_03310 [bacterium]|nr:hypothetical protein [bacterium]